MNFGGAGVYSGEQRPEEQNELKFKFNIGTDEIREMVGNLNKEPFNENFTLVSFDELNKTQMLQLTNKIFSKLDKSNDVNLREESQAKTLERFSDFLRILSYPGKFDQTTAEEFSKGEKGVLSPIIYFCLINFEDLKKRAYLGKFLVPILIPDEYMVDNEIKEVYNEYHQLIGEFKDMHKIYEEKTKDASSPEELKREINQMEQEKEQLLKRIKVFKKKTEGKEEFHKLLSVISKMRHEQEEETSLIDKLREQKRLLDFSDQQLLNAQQRIVDAKKAMGDETSAEEMLYALKSDVARNRNTYDEYMFEIKEKRKKLKENEERIYEPLPSHDTIMEMENKVIQLRTIVSDLSSKLERDSNKEKNDMISLQRRQVSLIAKQREKVENEMKKYENDKNDIEARIQTKIRELEKIKGPGYSSRSEIAKYQQSYKQKRSKQAEKERELNEVKSENDILRETIQILHEEKIKTDKRVRDYERKYGVEGLSKITERLDQQIEQKEEVDIMKGKTLEELSVIVQQLQQKIEAKKSEIGPITSEYKKEKLEFQEIEEEYNREKVEFDRSVASVKTELDETLEEFNKIKAEVYSDDSKIEILKHQISVIESFTRMLDDEVQYQKGTKQLNPSHKSYANWMKTELLKYEGMIKDLKTKRKFIKDNYEVSMKTRKAMNSIEEILKKKLQFKKSGGGAGILKGQTHHMGNMDVLVMNN